MKSCQVAGGTSIIHKTLDALRPPSVGTTLLLDITGFDGFACLAALEEMGGRYQFDHSGVPGSSSVSVEYDRKSCGKTKRSCWESNETNCSTCLTTTLLQEQSAGNRVISASVLLDAPSVDELTSRVANSVHNACRSGQLELPGFPDYGPVLAALKGGATETVHKDYKVCSVVNSSQLAVLQVYAQRWLDEELTKEQATRIITDHNAKFNPDGDFLQGEVKQLGFN